MEEPSSKFTSWLIEKRIPPSAASPAPNSHTSRITESTLMPDDAARSGLSLMARMALPVRVRCSAVATTMRTTRLMIVL